MMSHTDTTSNDATEPAGQDNDVPTGAAVAMLRVVGIAASAGGLEALRELFEGLPESDRLSCVVAQHVSPTHVSALADLLEPRTRLRVVDLADGDLPRPGTIAIVPPAHDAVLVDGRFRLVEPQHPIGPKPSADRLFRSLAEGLGESAVGIVLSGTGSDGAAGIRDIKAGGGLTIAQDPATARHDGMPRSAIHTGSVDLVLRPDEIGPALSRLLNRTGAAAPAEGDNALHAQIAHLVRVRTAFKLDEYKAATVHRRIARRIGLLSLPSLAAYVGHLRATPDEAQQLVRDTFISVTSFFRDGDAWLALQRAIGALVREARTGMLRCWVPGCATGEEAYGIAMLIEEALRTEQRADLQYMVFASDLDERALDRAREATYASHSIGELPLALRERYLQMDGDVGRMRKDVRARVVFARQNVIDDPRFSRMDLISCRNLLIYLNPPVQRHVLELFHCALVPGGRLFLGRSEALDGHADLFAPIELPARLYQRLGGSRPRAPAWRRPDGTLVATAYTGAERRAEPPAETLGRRMQAHLAQRYAPPSLLLDDANHVIRFEGALKPFLDFPSGGGSHLFDMVDTTIRAELWALVHRCRRERKPAQGAGHLRHVDGVPHDVRVCVEPLEHDGPGLLLLSFIARPNVDAPAAEQRSGAGEIAVVAELERELADTREHLVIVVDELQSANEQLQSANEEWQSANEELQSANEELRTVNEELQSTNEELLTVNEELQVKSGELEASASMLTNVRESLEFPLLVVDLQRRVLDANRACRQIVHVDAPLQGLSLRGLAWRIPIGAVDDDLARVFGGGERTVRDLPGDVGQQFRLHVMPYRTARQRIAGAVLLFEDVTALRGAEDRYRQVTESLPQLVWTCHADGLCDYLSPQWVRYTGVAEAEQLGFGWLEQLHPDDRQRAIEHWTRTAQHGLDFETEYRIRRHDGEYRWFHTLARPLRDARGTIVKWYGSNTDIDDRRRAEDALKVAADTLEQRVIVRTAALERATGELAVAVHELEDLYQNAPFAYHTVDAQGRILRINDTELRWLGYARDEVVGRPVTEFLTPAGRATFAARYPRLQAGEAQSNLEIDCLRKDGSELPMLVSATPVFDADGRYLHSRSVLLDHTLPRAQQRTLRSILTAAPMAVRIARLRDHRVVFVNKAYTELVRRDVDEALKLDARQFYVDKAAFDAIVRRLAAGESVRNQLVELQRPDDPERVWALASFMVIDHEGERAALAWLFDVTELQQARRLAEEASQTKSRFLANMSHEIRTPMNGVIGMIELARRDLSDPVLVDRLDKAVLSARQLLAILNDILDLSKIEAGHARLNLAPTDLLACVEGVRALYGHVAQQKGLALEIEVDPALAGRAVMADALRLRQVLDNLVANAIKFSMRGRVRVAVATEREDGSGASIRFEVSDQGIGIAPADQVRVFEMFEQADAGPGPRAPGTGLGLAISKEIVAMMGGEIGLRSQAGAGSTFWFTVRTEWAAAVPAVTEPPVAGPELGGLSLHAGAHVLGVEDNEINQEVLRFTLEGLGFQVDIAVNGREAVEAAAQTRYRLIFMDMRMPVMDGLEATRALRRDGLNTGTPVIAMTANAFEEDRQACLAAGMDDFLTKPLLPEDLARKSLEWLERLRP